MQGLQGTEWVEYVTGMSETEFRQKKEKYVSARPSKYTTPEMIITNAKTKEEFSCGSLEIMSLEELRNIAKKAEKPKKPAMFEIIVRTDNASINQVNVATMQANPEYKEAVFLAASNFNGVESVSEHIPPYSEDFTANYVFDPTQGPMASVGAPAAALQRTIFPFYDEKKDPKCWEQREEKQIEMLKEVDGIYHVVNGYPLLDENAKEPRVKDTKLFRGVIHSNVEISMLTSYGGVVVLPKEQRQRVDQVFAAATNVGQGSSGRRNGRIASTRPYIVKYTLDCGYETTYLTAIKNQRKTIVLTLLGGGVFGNPTEEICQSILDIHEKYGLKQNGTLERVVMPFFSVGGGMPYVVLERMLKERKIPYVIKKYKNDQLIN